MPISAVTASVTTQTIYPVMVNGYLCFSAAEVAEARGLVTPNTSKITATTAATGQTTRTAYPIMVNGYMCFSAAQVTAARNFINPFAGTTGFGVPSQATTTLTTYTANAASWPTAARGTTVNLFV